MKRLLAIALLLTAATAVYAQSFTVRVTGKGAPVIFIPGLSSPGDVWDATSAHLSSRYECHVLTLAGFAGTKPINESLLPAVKRDLATYIRDNHLEHPVVIGHSLGGFLALWLAETEPDLVGPVISVDGLPYAAELMMHGASPADVAKRAESMRAMVAAQTPEQFAKQTEKSLGMMITNKDDVARVAKIASQSDPPTVGEAMRFMLTSDLRPELGRIKSPVLLIAPTAAMPGGMADRIVPLYESQIAAVPQHLVVRAAKARHFAMLDDPAFLNQTIDEFLSKYENARR